VQPARQQRHPQAHFLNHQAEGAGPIERIVLEPKRLARRDPGLDAFGIRLCHLLGEQEPVDDVHSWAQDLRELVERYAGKAHPYD
jgi:hypothetical protein